MLTIFCALIESFVVCFLGTGCLWPSYIPDARGAGEEPNQTAPDHILSVCSTPCAADLLWPWTGW
jgi:hypothetical protein